MQGHPNFCRDRPEMNLDPLSEVLSLLSNQSSFFGGLKAGGNWAVRFPAPEGVKFNVLVRGACWLAVEGEEKPIWLEAGDCFLLSRRRPLSIGSDLSLPPLDAEELYRHAANSMAHCGTSEDCFLVGGRFTFGDEADLLFDCLPPVAVIKSESDQAAVLRWALQRLSHELSTPSPGGALMVQHLGHIMLVQVLRIYLEQEGAGIPGWLSALSEPRIAPAIQAIHTSPAKRWTVDALAEVAGVSRSTLALHFKQVAGLSPLEYVVRWRMQLAARSLRNNRRSISSIAQALGYESDSAFSNAFKRVMKCSPRDYRDSKSSRARSQQ
ncbi:AraC family transcriptional regulator [Burkholderia pseudomallei]|uniref:AraC family transcriptional regulator n=1 Tax=Burkholderia pseudomallei TaxID=28450 RepID=UPI002DB78D7E|nr:AraC family transcriptional regulator [Burkholderia pseudomallei]MEB5485031.1 AraC family transcriptional regulator [Burkholderia pseudomallei]MEB5491778.1 AraC family transcriptional regulator [Burkholderia pseudomallei]MEB5498580.1 AraC family transcriptional regulator [Burkholderia pseudomallei]MEB5503752.1 AraC family transcriptional regulator [Burkholderia pseudomallei]MEB5511517.1 AraC family transcriptional regulator [Burkholderia pseudomallei]